MLSFCKSFVFEQEIKSITQRLEEQEVVINTLQSEQSHRNEVVQPPESPNGGTEEIENDNKLELDTRTESEANDESLETEIYSLKQTANDIEEDQGINDQNQNDILIALQIETMIRLQRENERLKEDIQREAELESFWNH